MTWPDGYSDVPNRKIATVVTSLEMRRRPGERPAVNDPSWGLRHVRRPDPDWYRDLYRRAGSDWLWFSRISMSDAELVDIIHDPRVEVRALETGGEDHGLLELDFRNAGACELSFLGLTRALLGTGAGRWLMNHAIACAWSKPIERFWVHTCTLDHPNALAFYQRSGFTPFRRQIEIADDPRLSGLIARTAAPHAPVLEE